MVPLVNGEISHVEEVLGHRKMSLYLHGTAVTGELDFNSDLDFSAISPDWGTVGNAGGGIEGEQRSSLSDRTMDLIDYISLATESRGRRTSVHFERSIFRERLLRGFAVELRPAGNQKKDGRSAYKIPVINRGGEICVITLECPQIKLKNGAALNFTPQSGQMSLSVSNGSTIVSPRKFSSINFICHEEVGNSALGKVYWALGLQLSKIVSDTPVNGTSQSDYNQHVLQPILDAAVSLQEFGVNDPFVLIKMLKVLNENRKRANGSLKMSDPFFNMVEKRIDAALSLA